MRQKMFRSLFGLGMICICVATVLLSILFYNIWKEDFRENLESEAQTITAIAEAGHLDKNMLIKIGNHNGNSYRLTWVRGDGHVIFDSNSDATTMENHLQRPEIQQALLTGHGSSMRDSDTIHETNYYEAERLADGSVIRVSKVGANIYRVLIAAIPGILILFALMTFVCFIMAKRITARMIRPIETAISEWGQENSNQSIVRLSTDYAEIGPLIALLDTQKEHLQENVQTIETERNTLRDLMEEMKDGILLANSDGEVQVYNSNLRKFFKFTEKTEFSKLTLYDLSHSQDWLDNVHQVLDKKENNSYRVQVGNRYYQITTYLTGAGHRILVIVSDITDDFLAQQRRHEFTSNVSHELKTPLTTISGYAEILANDLYEKKGDVKELGGYIYKAAQQMLEMIQSIMHLSKLEDDTTELAFEHLPVKALTDKAWEMLEKKRQGKNVTYRYEGDEISVFGNERLLEEVFINLLDNSIKFSGEKENQIIVKAKTEGKKSIVFVSDTGIGISNAKMQRIFERFYQVDESRGKHEGVGIGLALVKHILEIHKGTIRVESEEGVGTTFIITLPNEE